MAMLCESAVTIPENPDDWYGEVKVDGVRAMYGENGHFYGRRGNNITDKFPELKSDLRGYHLDGEIVCSNNSFDDTASRIHTKDNFLIQLLSKKKPVTFHIFDVLVFEGRNVQHLPLSERKKLLRSIEIDNERFSVMESFTGGSILDLWKTVVRNDGEGIVLKRKDGRYVDKRSSAWLKLKNFKEAILEFNNYESHPKGILIKNDDGIRVNVNGSQAVGVRNAIDSKGVVECEVQYLSYNPETKAYRFPSFRGMLN